MARIRTVKPEIWTDESFVTLSLYARLVFIGLFNFVDDEGRMEYSPFRIKMQILPADPADMSEILGEIRGEKMIDVYTVDNKEYLQVINFKKHQKVDKRSASKYPPPPEPADSPLIPPTDQGSRKGREGIKEGKGKKKESVDPFEIPPNLVRGVGDKDNCGSEPDPPPLSEIDTAFDGYNTTAKRTGLPLARILTPARRRLLGLRLKEIGGIDAWNNALQNLEKSEFCKGKNDRGWKADFDFMLQTKSLMRLLEGGYQNGEDDEFEKALEVAGR